MSHILRLTAFGQPSGQDIVLIGPRGSGKTVLLNWLESRADDTNVDVIRSTPDQIPDLNRLAEALMPPSRLEKLIPDELAVSLGSVVDGKWNLKTATPLSRAFAARCKESPVLLTIDEAHTLARDVARVLLNLSQSLHRSGGLLMLTLAGTPEFERTLKDAQATFWERCETLGIGLLAPEAAIRAVVEPFEARGIRFDQAVSARVPEITQNYAYFAATYGSALWKALAREGTATVSTRIAESASVEHDRTVRVFYSRRYSELEDAGLLDAARAVASRFARQPLWDRSGLHGAIRRVRGISDPAAAFEGLRDLGFVWRAPGETVYAAGIPSLMNFIEQSSPTGLSATRN